MQRVPELKGNVSSSPRSAPRRVCLCAGVGRGRAAERLASFLPPPANSPSGHSGCAGAGGPGRVCSERRGGVGSECFRGCCSASAGAQGASSASVGPPAPGRQAPLPSGAVWGMRGGSGSSPVTLTSCCGQDSPSWRILCISWKRYDDRVGEKMLQAGPDPLNDAPRCLCGQWRGSKPLQHSPAWQIRAGVRVAGCSPGHVPEGCVWPAVH